jgi:hypothetical protein
MTVVAATKTAAETATIAITANALLLFMDSSNELEHV